MKRHAIELWAAHADLDDNESMKSFPGLDTQMEGSTRLPWSMRSSEEIAASHHADWRQNQTIKTYLGEVYEERADGLVALLQDRPKDYVQILMLRVFGEIRSGINLKNSLKDLAGVAALAPEIKDIIFAEDAAINTVYGPPALRGEDQPVSLHDFLSGVEMTPRTQQEIIEGQRLRIHVLTNELAQAAVANTVVTEANETLTAHNNHLQTLLQQQDPHLPRTQADLVMLHYGLSPAMSTEMIGVVVKAIRQDYAKRLHADNGERFADKQEKLKEVNADLDDILKARGLGNARNPDPI
jgi:hypothetical protein